MAGDLNPVDHYQRSMCYISLKEKYFGGDDEQGESLIWYNERRGRPREGLTIPPSGTCKHTKTPPHP